MLELTATKENPEHGPNNTVSEQTGLMGDYLGSNDQPDEPKMKAPSTANGTRDNGIGNDDSNSNQVGPQESSSVRELPGEVWGSPLTYKRIAYICTAFGVLVIVDLIITSSLVIPLTTVKSPCPSCPEDWITWRGKCYYFSDAEGTWNSSQSNCSSYGASLFVPGPDKEMEQATCSCQMPASR